MEATPLEQVVVVAEATNCTGDVTVELLVGLVTVTVAKAGDTNARDTNARSARRIEGRYFMLPPLKCIERDNRAPFLSGRLREDPFKSNSKGFVTRARFYPGQSIQLKNLASARATVRRLISFSVRSFL
jgi:hypothetical protein